MLGIRIGGGNYSYATTRVKARKAFLFPREVYVKLLQMSIPEISRFIEESKYKHEVDELATKHSGIDLIEYALNLNMAKEMNDILGFCRGDPRLLLGTYLMRWDVWNIKSILRGKDYGAAEEDIRENLVPAGDLTMQQLVDLIRKPGIPEVIEGLSDTIFYQPLVESIEGREKEQKLPLLENTLDKVYYTNLLSIKVPGTKANKLFADFVRKEIDYVNLRTLFRLKRAGMEYDKIMEYLILGGAELQADDLKKLAQASSFDEFLNLLKEYSYWNALVDAVKKCKETGSLNIVEITLYKELIRYVEKISHFFPLSICPIIGYAIRKNTEINNIRTIARGKEMHLPDDVIKSQLVI